MGVGSALSIALSGLKTTQVGLDLAANNVANAKSADYSRRRLETSAQVIRDRTYGVQPGVVKREIDEQIQRQWRGATAEAGYSSTTADALGRLDSLLGGANNPTSLNSIFNGFKKAFETLSTSPENNTARLQAVAAADTLAQRLRTLTNDIQTLRQDAETSIKSAVDDTNSLLRSIAELDKQIISVTAAGQSSAALEDQRDAAIDKLSSYMDITVEKQRFGAVAIRTSSGTLLYDDQPVQLGFDERAVIGTGDTYSANSSDRGVGTIVIQSGPGAGFDLFRDSAFRSGKIAALKDLRDEKLVTAQAQLDTLAAQMATAISNRSATGSAVSSGGRSGFELDTSGLTAGNTLTVKYTDATGSHTVTFVAHDGAATIGDDYTADPKDRVVGLDLSGASGTIEAQMQAALGGNFQVTATGSKISVLDDGAADAVDIDSFTGSITNSGTAGGDAAFSLFIDSATGKPFTGLTGDKPSLQGFAGRIALNPALKADPSGLVLYGAGTQPSDAKRPKAVIEALTGTRFQFSPSTGIGSKEAPFSGSVEQFLGQFMSYQGAAAEAAKKLDEGQKIVTANLEERYSNSRKVDLDTELAQLIELQTAYQANARVMTAAREMLDVLMQMV